MPPKPILPKKGRPRPVTVINRDGSLNIHRSREPGRLFSDFYHYFLSISWPKFFAYLVLIFFITNLLFGSLYFYAGDEALIGAEAALNTKRFVECFFFSVQLFNAPYVPNGIWPNIIVTLQSYLGILTLVIITGLLYARFARPHARVLFSDCAIIGQYNGKPCFFYRVANERLNQIIEARMNLTCTKMFISKEGETSRKFYNMKLECEYSPLFALSWTLRHFIDEDSPIYGMDAESMRDQEVVIFASLSGIDDTFSQTITARTVYRYDEIIYGKKFNDMIIWEGNKVRINLEGIHSYS